MKKKCRYFLSRTNGKRLYINCSTDKTIQSSERVQFSNAKDRKLYYNNVCCSERFTECYKYQQLREGKNDVAG